jgi:hypothetical protein
MLILKTSIGNACVTPRSDKGKSSHPAVRGNPFDDIRALEQIVLVMKTGM